MTNRVQSVPSNPPTIAVWKVFLIACVISFGMGIMTEWFLYAHQPSEATPLPATVKLGN
jgi:hypothetical protein